MITYCVALETRDFVRGVVRHWEERINLKLNRLGHLFNLSKFHLAYQKNQMINQVKFDKLCVLRYLHLDLLFAYLSAVFDELVVSCGNLAS